MPRRLLCLFLLGMFLGGLRGADWTTTTWNGEPAYASSSQGWRAVVSVARARLIHFGPAGSDLNLLLAPASRENRNLLGGHRLWLGPQTTWKGFWPPPAAWEYREPASVAVVAGVLRLTMAPAGGDWPQLTRTYHWDGAGLVCGAEAAGGTRSAQFIQILQVKPAVLVDVTAAPEPEFPAGFVRLLSSSGPFAAHPDPTPHMSRAANALTLRHTGIVGKFGFRPQTLTGRVDGYALQVSRGRQTGETVGEPDAGFHTQVYLSGTGESFVELEQLSPLFAAGAPARFEIILTGQAQ